MQKAGFIIEKLIKWFVYGMFLLTIFIVVIALFSNETEGEAGIGSFDSQSMNENWILERNGESTFLSLPQSVNTDKGEVLIIKNTLPSDLPDGCSLLTRASMADIYIYINDELREQYATESIDNMSFYIPSAYVVTELSEKDSGAEIMIKIHAKTHTVLNEVQISKGNNVWFRVIQKSLPVNAIVLVVIILGVILVIVSKVMRHISENAGMSFFLGVFMIDMGIWVFSESDLRQLIFAKPSLSQYFAYFSVELLGAFACMYFDEVQHKKHHKSYVIVELLISTQLLINMALHFAGIADFYETLMISHIWLGIGVLIATINIVDDIRSKRITQYLVTALGMAGFLVMAVLELVGFYVTRFHVFGIFACSGLVVLAVATVVQALIDQMRDANERHNKQTQIIVNTIETVAVAIDAKDEYTGGHSERVGQYAAILARGMAADYDFSEEDILRIHYIGIMHDIGKIGVADTVLNKPGRLTESEFSLMKKHVEIGSEILAGMNESISGLVDGIRYHHERFDGKGYPEGLSDTEIPLVARILCLADCYDAMTSNRVYRKRLTDEEVRAEFIRCAGTQFDPALAEIFVKLLDSGEMHPYTVEGMATSEKGTVLKSAVLENRLQEMTMSQDTLVNHPEHVRMLCFIMKLKEKKREHMDVFIVSLKEDEIPTGAETHSMIGKMIKSHLKMKDVSIECNDSMRIIALFEKTDEEIENFEKDLNSQSAYVSFERI
mgnify:CR=1 FL=1